jgi:transcription antitermination factor NusG
MLKTHTSSAAWYLLYTAPRSEKKAKLELDLRGFNTYLPVQKLLKQWSDRKKWVEEPLFRSYLFIHTELEKNYFEVLNVPGIVKFVSFEKRPVLVQDKHIQLIKLLLGNFNDLEATTYEPTPGDEVEIITGVLAGHKAKVIRKGSAKQVFVEFPEMMQSLKINIPLTYIKPIQQTALN